MSATLTHQSSRRSISSAVSLSGGMQLFGGGQTRISTCPAPERPPSVYGGAGGYGTRISVFSSGPLAPFGEITLTGNEKLTMQNLNERLASYLVKVRSLEEANRKLEVKIREFYEKSAPSVSRDLTGYYETITNLRDQIKKSYLEYQAIFLKLDNAQLTIDDFKMRYEMEQTMHSSVLADLCRLRGIRDSMTLFHSELEMQIEGLKEELVYMKSSHEEELSQLKIQQSGRVNVEVDSVESVNLTKILEEMREQYEALIMKNKLELQAWYNAKVETLQTKISECSKDVKTFTLEISESKRTYQSYEISRQESIHVVERLQKSLDEVKCQYSVQLNQMQQKINTIELEQQQLRVSMEQQRTEYNLLLDIKMRLEMEIAEYRRLLDGELNERGLAIQKNVVVIDKVVEVVEEHKPHIEKRVKTIIEKIVDGEVVSCNVDVKVEEIQ